MLQGRRQYLPLAVSQAYQLRRQACERRSQLRPVQVQRRDSPHWPELRADGIRGQSRAIVQGAYQPDQRVHFDRPVTLPPGRARLATRPLSTGLFATAKTIGMIDVACFIAWNSASCRDDDIDVEPHELPCDFGKALVASLRPAIFDCNSVTIDPSEFAQPLHKNGDPFAPGRGRGCTQEPDGPKLALLCAARRSATRQPLPPTAPRNSRRHMSVPWLRSRYRIGSNECFDRGRNAASLLQHAMRADVRFGSLADISGGRIDVSYAAVRDRNSRHRGQSTFALPRCLTASDVRFSGRDQG